MSYLPRARNSARHQIDLAPLYEAATDRFGEPFVLHEAMPDLGGAFASCQHPSLASLTFGRETRQKAQSYESFNEDGLGILQFHRANSDLARLADSIGYAALAEFKVSREKWDLSGLY